MAETASTNAIQLSPLGTTLVASMGSAPNNYNPNAAFGLGRAIPRPYYKFTLILAADASGNWVPQQAANVPIIVFEHGVNDTFTGIANPFINAGITGTPAARSLEITNSPRNGGFSMLYQAIILGIGIVLERVRVITADANNVARVGTTPAHVQRSGGTVGDNEWALSDRLLISLLGASEWQLIPVNDNTDCNLMLGVGQLMPARIGWENGPPSPGQNRPSTMFAFRDDILVNPGVSGNNDQPNRLGLYWLDGVLASVEKLTDSTSRTAGDLLALDLICVVDVAFGRMMDDGNFRFATEFDAKKYEEYRACV